MKGYGSYMLRLSFVVSLIICTLYGIQKIQAYPQTPIVPSGNDKQFERAVLKYVWPALDYGQKVGRIYYSAACQPNANGSSFFPRLNVQPPSDGKIGISAVRDIFRLEKRVSVKESDTGVIRITIGLVPDDVLRVRIASLVLTPEEQYNYWSAIFKIENAPEVQNALQQLKISATARVTSFGIVRPADGLPHLPSVFTNVTMDQALDLVAKTFGGIVLYTFCTPPDQYEIRFANAAEIYSTQ